MVRHRLPYPPTQSVPAAAKPPARAARAPVAPPPARPSPPPAAPAEVEIFEDVEQGSEEWFRLRLGTPTASNFRIMMAAGKDDEESKTRARLMRQLAGEILTGRPAEGKLKTAAMQRGTDMEPAARAYYERRNFIDIRRVGFIRRRLPSGGWAGCSPDGLIEDKKAVEFKSMAPDLMIERLLSGAGMPSEHRAQCQGTLWVGDLEEIELMIYYDNMPVCPTFRLFRDESYIRELSRAVEIFEYETRMLVERIRKMAS